MEDESKVIYMRSFVFHSPDTEVRATGHVEQLYHYNNILSVLQRAHS